MALKHPSLLLLGLLRFFIVLLLWFVLSGIILVWHEQILSMVWSMPENQLLLYLWHALSWLLSLVLVAVAMILSYLLAQIFFGVFIMDYMSRITERLTLGREVNPVTGSLVEFFVYLIVQELPRTIIPVLISMTVMLLGFLTPLGPILFVISSGVAIVFMAWDSTDLVGARNMAPLKERFAFLRKHWLFHLGFGIWFLIPWLNILFLSYAPVGGTLYAIGQQDKSQT